MEFDPPFFIVSQWMNESDKNYFKRICSVLRVVNKQWELFFDNDTYLS